MLPAHAVQHGSRRRLRSGSFADGRRRGGSHGLPGPTVRTRQDRPEPPGSRAPARLAAAGRSAAGGWRRAARPAAAAPGLRRPAAGLRRPQPGAPQPGQQQTEDEQAVQRYEYLLRTAPPEKLEQAHEQAFAQLTPAQRQQVLNKLAQANPDETPRDDSPQSLARSATRIEMQRPGTLRNAFGGPGGGQLRGGMGGAGLGMGGLLLGTVAAAFVGTAIANELFNDMDAQGELADGADPGAEGGDQGGDAGDPGADQGGDLGGEAGVDQGGDLGGEAGVDQAGDFGGGDFGGSDFGGGDFGGGDFGGGFDGGF
ncbi:hypothetical protein [Barrientosiimonas endolithica]|uniref:DUF2076 domain-containing protein n=1 Tax=Barrientosiimonas endolithica TaxID=1535208 RepID=A0ABM8H8L9_9MICO|nr:hypothetical protein [Barrientosiimonas endolithica]BDZ57232.1 hypothetical protein GCM10025872_08890 [Barrientosiimonas endolithica]